MFLSSHGVSREDLPARFRRFAELETLGVSPLYEALARAGAEIPAALELAAMRQPGQAPVNMVLGAAHRLLLGGDSHPLREFYPSVVASPRPPDEVGPVFADYLSSRFETLAEIVRRRRVSTNEPGRSAPLIFALGEGLRRLGHDGPIALIDVGASAGLNLHPDRLALDFGDGRRGGAALSDVVMRLSLTPADAPPPPPLPSVLSRVGLDLHPLDPADPDDAAWLRALIWPEQAHRVRRLEAALSLARAEPPRLVPGDAVEMTPRLVAEAPAEALVCVTHTVMLYQLPEAARAAFEAALIEASRGRPLLRAGVEQEGEAAPTIRVSAYRGGERLFDARLGLAAPHGDWIALDR